MMKRFHLTCITFGGGGSDQIITFEGFETAASIFARSLINASDAPLAFWWERLEGEEEQWRVVQDGEPVDTIVCTSFWDSQFIALSADGEHYGYPCISQEGDDDTEVSVVRDGTEYGPYVT